MNKIVIASDSFKGSLSSIGVASSLEDGILEVLPDCEVLKVQVADGGEGTVDAVMDLRKGEWMEVTVSDPLGRPVGTRYGAIDGCALIEISSASGLPLLSTDERNPSLTSSYGSGEMISDAIDRGFRKFIIGLGGSATNDGGTGMLTALGARFLDAEGRLLRGCGADLRRIARADLSGMRPELSECSFTVACDVDTPFCGPQGAAYIFAPQKGADPAMVEMLDAGLRNLAAVIASGTGRDISTLPGSGAAGGLGGAFAAFLDAELKRGVDLILDIVGFDSIIEGADLVITGEGKMDSQTGKGKTPDGVLGRAAGKGIPVVAFAGKVERCPQLEALGFERIIQVSDPQMPLEKAMLPEVTSARLREAVKGFLSEYC